MNPPFEILSIGFASQSLQVSIPAIIATADQLGINPSFINGVAHYTGTDIENIRAAITDQVRRRECASVDQRSGIM